MRIPKSRRSILLIVFLVALPTNTVFGQEAFSVCPAKLGEAYQCSLLSIVDIPNAIGKLSWKVQTGNELPAGIVLDGGSDVLTGIPRAWKTGGYEFIIEVSDEATPPRKTAIRFKLEVENAPLRVQAKKREELVVRARPAGTETATAAEEAKDGEAGEAVRKAPADRSSSQEAKPPIQPKEAAEKPKSEDKVPRFDSAIVEGTRKLSGKVKKGTEKVRVEIWQDNKLVGAQEKAVEAESESFEMDLAAPLIRGQKLKLIQFKSDKSTEEAEAAKVEAAGLEPSIRQPVREGAVVIRGFAPSGVEKVIVKVLAKDAGGADFLEDKKIKQKVVALVQMETGEFTAALTEPLAAGQVVKVASLAKNATLGAASEAAVVESVTYDWGRIKAQFIVGLLFSHDREEFSKADYFLAFNLDKE